MQTKKYNSELTKGILAVNEIVLWNITKNQLKILPFLMHVAPGSALTKTMLTYTYVSICRRYVTVISLKWKLS